FGSGGGIVVVPAMIHLLKVKEHDAHATAIAVILPLSLISIFVYFKNDYFDWDMLWKVSIGGIVGAGIGAWLLPRVTAKLLNKMFAVVMILAGIRMVF
ncbi:MAG: sulfite exporter TauE/SafE family protein, partial [Clostridiales bacterium]|nr:sulfite exporter TauE/SafE family protein [Clostridiales bacterium]